MDRLEGRNAEKNPRGHATYVAGLVEHLAQLEMRTRPSQLNVTAADKDWCAVNSLRLAGKLVDAVAGWAIDHEIGLAAGNLQSAPRQPAQTSDHPHYLQQKAMADDHRHEGIGATEAEDESADPQFLRACLINLIRCNSGGWPAWMCQTVVDALEGLEFGEVHPIFEKSTEGKKRDLTERKLMLRAVAMVRFRRTAYGCSKEDALAEVGSAIAASPNTVKSWETRLKQEVPLEVDRTLAFAENHASCIAAGLKQQRQGQPFDQQDMDFHESGYGPQALKILGQEFRAARGRAA